MKLSLNEIKYLVSQIIFEGYQDDLVQLKKKFPGEARALEGAPFVGPKGPKWVAWLVPRYLAGKIREPLPFEHIVFTIKDFAAAEQRLGALWNQPAFVELVNARIPPAGRRWRSPTDITNMSAGEMDALLHLVQQAGAKKRDRLGIDYDTVDVSGDRLGQVGPWTLWMPSTRENSCAIVRVRDPQTGEMKPSPCTWCTARTEGSNLFYNYVARNKNNIILFYIIKENPKEENDFISIGFLDGEMIVDDNYGGITVNCNNAGLNEKKLKNIFGEYYENIIKILSEKNDELEGEHPAKTKILDAGQNLESLNYLLNGLGVEEKADLATQVLDLGEGNIKPEIEKLCFEIAAKSSDINIFYRLLELDRCPEIVFEKIVNDPNLSSSYHLMELVANNKNCPVQILMDVIHYHKSEEIRESTLLKLLRNPKCPEHFLEYHANSDIKENYRVVVSSIENPKLSPEILDKIERKNIIQNKGNDTRTNNIGAYIARNPNTPSETLRRMYKNEEYRYRFSSLEVSLLKNPNCPADIIEKIADSATQESNAYVKKFIGEHPNTPAEILLFLAKKSETAEFRFFISNNPNFPKEEREKNLNDFSNHFNYEIRALVAKSTKTPMKFLKKLANDENSFVAHNARDTIAKLEMQQESFKKKINNLIKQL